MKTWWWSISNACFPGKKDLWKPELTMAQEHVVIQPPFSRSRYWHYHPSKIGVWSRFYLTHAKISLLLWKHPWCFGACRIDSLTSTQVSTEHSENRILQQHTIPSSHVCNFTVQRRFRKREGQKQIPMEEGDEVPVLRDRKKTKLLGQTQEHLHKRFRLSVELLIFKAVTPSKERH